MPQTAEKTPVEQETQPKREPREKVFRYRQNFETFLAAVGRAAGGQGVSYENIQRIKELLCKEFEKDLP